MKFKFTKLFCLLAAVSFFLYSCGSTNSNTDSPPEVPPAESMSVDFSDMENAEKTTASKVAESNFNTALLAAGIAKVILEANLAIPKVLLEAAGNHEAEANGNGEWEWEYSSNTNGNSYGVRLTAAVESSEDVTWNFYVTNSAVGIDNQLFFSGNTDYEATSGTWTYYNIQTGEEVSFLTWERSEGFASVDLEVTNDQNGNFGDTIDYDFDGTVKTVVFYDASDDATTTISFNTETKAGFIIAPNYNEGEKSCWDSDLNNITCS